MKLSTKSRYALEGLVYIAIYSPNEAIRIKQIAEDTGITVAYLEQIFFLLKKAGAEKVYFLTISIGQGY